MNRGARSLAVVTLLVVTASSLHAQTAPTDNPSTGPLTSVYRADFLRDLPTADSVFAVIDTLQPSVTADRFASGGLFVGQPARIGGSLSSWTQSTFRLDGVSITDPTGAGVPLLVPELGLWDRVTVRTGLGSLTTSSGGVDVNLTPARPTDRWTRRLDGAFSHGPLDSRGTSGLAPPSARLDGWDRGAFLMSGPIIPDRIGATFAVSGTRDGQFWNGDPFPVAASMASGLAHFRFTPNSDDTIGLTGWLQHRQSPLAQRTILLQAQARTAVTASHAQAVWDHQPHDGLPWGALASYTGRRTTPSYGAASTGILDRLTQGPVDQFADLSTNTVQTWSLGAHVQPHRLLREHDHQFVVSLDAEGGRGEASSWFTGTIGELLHESPGRVWVFTAPNVPSIRHTTIVGVSAGDEVSLNPRVHVGAGLRIESARGHAEGSAGHIAWTSVLPRVSAHLAVSDRWHVAAFGAYSRSAQQLRLDDLAYGDPGAPTADVFRWNTLAGLPLALSDRGPLVARVGPGTRGDATFSAIDPAIKRPIADALVLGVDAEPLPGFSVRLSGVTTREQHLIGLTDPGLPSSGAYDVFTTVDPGSDVLNAADDQVLQVYNREPASFGQDRYLLTNPGQQGSTFRGVELSLRLERGPLLLAGGATAGIAETFAASLGDGPLENDQTVVGDAFVTANAAGLSHGRPFTDRAYTGKFAVIYRLPREIRLGVVARYQDGQPFARVVVFPGLNQGADAVRAFANGESRFKYIGTLDARVRKMFSLGGRRLDGYLDVYNLLNMANSVEEDVSAAPDVRIPLALQPARAAHIGLAFSF